MPRRKRTGPTRKQWGAAHVIQLAFGIDYFQDAWGDGPHDDETTEEMKAAYRRHADYVEQTARDQHGSKARSWASGNLF